MEKSKINKAADILYNCRINIKRIKQLPNDCTPKSIQEAYAIQDELAQKYLLEKKKFNNWKKNWLYKRGGKNSVKY